MMKNKFKEEEEMKIKRICSLIGIAFWLWIGIGYGGLQYEKELALKFCPSLQLHSRDQGLSPKPVDIMSNGRNDGRTNYLDENNLFFVSNLLGVDRWPDQKSYLLSINNPDQTKAQGSKKRKKGKIIGIIVGAGIGAGAWYYTYYNFTGPEGMIFPAIIGSMIGGVIGGMIDSMIENHYDKKPKKEKKKYE